MDVERDFYVWADEQPDGPKDVVFPDAEDSPSRPSATTGKPLELTRFGDRWLRLPG